ncbi:MAG: hypothetical protein NC321_03320 [Clostridium sp.]|nr:hypothetical protein [Clostridium sp.]
MYKIIIAGAGSSQSNGVINCLLKDKEENEIIGIGSDKYDLMLCNAHKKYLIPHSTKPDYKETLLKILEKEKPDMIHFNHDVELAIALKFEDEIRATGVKMLVPDYETIDTCVYKYKSWKKFKEAGVIVPENQIIHTEDDLRNAFSTLADDEGNVWFRPMIIGNGARGAIKTNEYEEAKEWIDNASGWGNYMAAEVLPGENVTWMAIWNHGELIVAQGRKRGAWAYSAMSPNGISGLTKIGITYSSEELDGIGINCCKAVSKVPHGIYGVDLKCDKNGVPNPTEINISRFFATVEFFAEAGLNMPVILKDLCLYQKKPELERICNPLQDNLLWIRGMDERPVLTTEKEIERKLIKI